MERGPCSLWSRLKGRGSRCIEKHSRTSVEAKRSGLGWAWPGPAMCVVAVMARLGEVRLDMAGEGGSVEVRQRKARCGKAVRVGLGEGRLAWLGVARR